MTLIIDTSVIVKWFVKENGHEEAIKLLETSEHLVCPDFALIEAANALWRKVRQGEINIDQASTALQEVSDFFDDVAPCSKYLSDAFSLAQKLDHSIYDCLFLAIATQNSDNILITDDSKFAKKCVSGGFADKLRPLRNQPLLLELTDEKIHELLALLEKFEQTKEFVEESTRGKSENRKPVAFSLGEITPAFESPIYLRLKQKVSKLDENSAQSIIAICWYGRESGSMGFEGDYEHAQTLSASPDEHAPYIISILRYYEMGLARLKFTHPQHFTKHSGKENG